MLGDACRGFHGYLAGQYEVERSTDGVDVGVRSFAARGRVLLGGGIAVRQHRGLGLRLVLHKFARRTEVYQYGLVVGRNHDVVGLDVAVQYVAFVYVAYGVGYLGHVVHGFGVGEGAFFVYNGLQRPAFDKGHHHVRGVVLVKDVYHLHNAGVAQPG